MKKEKPIDYTQIPPGEYPDLPAAFDPAPPKVKLTRDNPASTAHSQYIADPPLFAPPTVTMPSSPGTRNPFGVFQRIIAKVWLNFYGNDKEQSATFFVGITMEAPAPKQPRVYGQPAPFLDLLALFQLLTGFWHPPNAGGK